MKRKQIKLCWSKREKDWLFSYPDNAGCSLMGVFFDMVKPKPKSTIITPKLPESLIELLTERGYDYKTFTVTCKKIQDEETSIT